MTTPRKSINPAFLKLKPHRDEIDELYGLTEEEIKVVEGEA